MNMLQVSMKTEAQNVLVYETLQRLFIKISLSRSPPARCYEKYPYLPQWTAEIYS